jgi:hypothetical protein
MGNALCNPCGKDAPHCFGPYGGTMRIGYAPSTLSRNIHPASL